jgi:hypothetical protein
MGVLLVRYGLLSGLDAVVLGVDLDLLSLGSRQLRVGFGELKNMVIDRLRGNAVLIGNEGLFAKINRTMIIFLEDLLRIGLASLS